MYFDLKPWSEWAMNGAHATHCMNEIKKRFALVTRHNPA